MNYYGSSSANVNGWAAGAAVAGAAAVTGAAVGAATASANTAVASSNAYNAGYNAGPTGGAAAAPTYAMGQIVASLPAGCITPTVQGTTYYLWSNTWFSAAYGANGVYYRVGPSP